jgi:hypothetical protein
LLLPNLDYQLAESQLALLYYFLRQRVLLLALFFH